MLRRRLPLRLRPPLRLRFHPSLTKQRLLGRAHYLGNILGTAYVGVTSLQQAFPGFADIRLGRVLPKAKHLQRFISGSCTFFQRRALLRGVLSKQAC